jgi:hypothetical protein
MSADSLLGHWLSAFTGQSESAVRRSARHSTFRPTLQSLEDRIALAGSIILNGTVLSVRGDPGATSNQFQFSEMTTTLPGTTQPVTNFSVAINGQMQQFTSAQVSQILVFGVGANNTGLVVVSDTFTVPGLSTPQHTPYTVVSSRGGGYLLNGAGNIFLQFAQFQNTTVYVHPADTSYLYTIAGSSNSVFASSGTYGYVAGSGEFHLISGAATLNAISLNATDQAFQYDVNGQETFVASSNLFSSMSGSVSGRSFMNVAIGFPTNFGIAMHGGLDVATLIDSPGNDTFFGTTSFSYMSSTTSGHTFFNEVQRFGRVTAESIQGGQDVAFNFDIGVNVLVGNWMVGF